MPNHYHEIVSDMQEAGYDFRIIDLDESLQIKVNGKWELMTDTLAAVLEMDMYELGDGVFHGPVLWRRF